jgi:predicted nuclease of restriction endonuclease-like RecB superfamily
VEIVGFWTREHLEKRLEQLSAAGVARLVLCVDEQRGCRDEEIPEGALVIPYRKKVDAARVLAAIEGAGLGQASAGARLARTAASMSGP